MSKEREHGNAKHDDDEDDRYFKPPWPWPAAFWMPMGKRSSALQERIIRDHQRQLGQIGRKVASGDYTPQSMVAEAWRFWARVWGDAADWTRILYDLDVERMKDAPRDLAVHRMRAVIGDESPELVFSLESAKLPPGRSRLLVNALKSSDADYTIPGENISFHLVQADPKASKVDFVERDVRGEQDVKVIVTKLPVDGNQAVPGLYAGTIQAVQLDSPGEFPSSRVIGLLLLELVGKGH